MINSKDRTETCACGSDADRRDSDRDSRLEAGVVGVLLNTLAVDCVGTQCRLMNALGRLETCAWVVTLIAATQLSTLVAKEAP